MRVRRTDDNQALLVKQMRRIPGVTIAHTHTIGKGFPDLVLGFKGRNYLIEVKDGSKTRSRKKLTEDEQEFHEKWTGKIFVVECIDDLLNILKTL